LWVGLFESYAELTQTSIHIGADVLGDVEDLV
jgi:hypothetical protein